MHYIQTQINQIKLEIIYVLRFYVFQVYQSPTIITCVVESHNALLTTHWLLDQTEVALDNEPMYEICQKWLDRKRSSYDNLNQLITKTNALQFEGKDKGPSNDTSNHTLAITSIHIVFCIYNNNKNKIMPIC